MKYLIQDVNSLPPIPQKIKRLYADFETSSGDDNLTSLNPHHNCTPIGLAITWDDNPDAYFVTHETITYLSEGFYWLRDLFDRTINWVNHNIKYDAHVLLNWYFANLPKHLALFDTLVMAKLVDSDRKFKGGYALDVLSKAWLDEDISHFEIALYQHLNGSKDYGRCPIEIMSEYECNDVITNRKIDHYIMENLSRSCYSIKNIEKETTRTLFAVERTGFHVNNVKLAKAALKAKGVLVQTLEKFERQYHPEQIEPHIPDDIAKVLLGMYNLPVLKKTPGGKPCFDKKTLKKYLTIPEAPRDFINECLEYRQINTFVNGFIKPALRFQNSETIRCTYNQTVRTGRMSCSEPNLTAMSGLAKKLILPREGKEFICADYSQIEFRLIGHVAKEQSVIDAYNRDPFSDFHGIVATLCLMDRDPAKTINFATAYGMGEKSLREALAINPKTQELVKARGGDYQTELILYVKELRKKYFEMFPNFRRASNKQCGMHNE